MESISVFSERVFELISHPDRTLKTHLQGCNDISKKQLEFKYVNADSFYDKVLLERMRLLLVYFHDFGKASYFQDKIIAATENSDKNEVFRKETKTVEYLRYFHAYRRKIFEAAIAENERLTNHALIGAYFVLPQLEHEDEMLRLILFKIIQRHHGNLTDFFISKSKKQQFELKDYTVNYLEKQISALDFSSYSAILATHNLNADAKDWDNVKALVPSPRRIPKHFASLGSKKDVRYFFLQHYLFSLLLSADKGDMMLPSQEQRVLDFVPVEGFPSDLIDAYKAEKHGKEYKYNLDRSREEAYQVVTANAKIHAQKGFFSITLPTGLGKTYAAYNAALILQQAYYEQTGCMPRIVYVLPFTSIIDQNEAILREILIKSGIENAENRLSKNHYLSTPNERCDDRELDSNSDEAEYLADGWEHDIIVTTFVQLLEGIFTDSNKQLRKFHNMTNAIFILDEVQNIPPKYFEAVALVFQKMNEYFRTKFVLVTATQPFLFKEADAVQELADPEKYFKGLKRTQLDQTLLTTHSIMELDDFAEVLIQDIEAQSYASSFMAFITSTRLNGKIELDRKSTLPNCAFKILYSSCADLIVLQIIKNDLSD